MRGWFGFFHEAGIWGFWLLPVARSPNPIMEQISRRENPVEREKLWRIMPTTCGGKFCVQRFRGGKIRLATFSHLLAPLAHPLSYSCAGFTQFCFLGLYTSSLHMTRRADPPIQLEEYFRCGAGSDFCKPREFVANGLREWSVRGIPEWDQSLLGIPGESAKSNAGWCRPRCREKSECRNLAAVRFDLRRFSPSHST